MANPTQRATARQIAERIVCQIEAQWSVAYLRGYIEEAIATALAEKAAPPPLSDHAIRECNEAHALLDTYSVPKTKRVLAREATRKIDVTLGLADRIAALAADLAQAQQELETYDPEWSAQVASLTADLAQAQQELAHWRSAALEHGHTDAHSWSLATAEAEARIAELELDLRLRDDEAREEL